MIRYDARDAEGRGGIASGRSVQCGRLKGGLPPVAVRHTVRERRAPPSPHRTAPIPFALRLRRRHLNPPCRLSFAPLFSVWASALFSFLACRRRRRQPPHHPRRTHHGPARLRPPPAVLHAPRPHRVGQHRVRRRRPAPAPAPAAVPPRVSPSTFTAATTAAPAPAAVLRHVAPLAPRRPRAHAPPPPHLTWKQIQT